MRNTAEAGARALVPRAGFVGGLCLAIGAVLLVVSSGAPQTAALTIPPVPNWLMYAQTAASSQLDNTLTMARSSPTQISIPAIGVESALMDLGLTTAGELEVPPTGFPAGWFTGAPTPGELGPAVIAGHVSWAGRDGVFHELHKVQPGDQVFVLREDGSTAVFEVQSVEQYAKNAFPTAVVYGDIDHAGLRLITCGGEFDWDVVSYRDNIVVFATLVEVAVAS